MVYFRLPPDFKVPTNTANGICLQDWKKQNKTWIKASPLIVLLPLQSCVKNKTSQLQNGEELRFIFI